MELRDIDKIKEGKEQRSYTNGFVITMSLFSFLLGMIAGFYFSDSLKEIFKLFPFAQ